METILRKYDPESLDNSSNAVLSSAKIADFSYICYLLASYVKKATDDNVDRRKYMEENKHSCCFLSKIGRLGETRIGQSAYIRRCWIFIRTIK